MKKRYISLVFFGILGLTSCQDKTTTTHEHAKEEVAHEGEGTNEGVKEVELNTAQKKAAGIVMGQLEDKNLTDVIKVNGQTELPRKTKPMSLPF